MLLQPFRWAEKRKDAKILRDNKALGGNLRIVQAHFS